MNHKKATPPASFTVKQGEFLIHFQAKGENLPYGFYERDFYNEYELNSYLENQYGKRFSKKVLAQLAQQN